MVQKKTILVVDDEVKIMEIIKTYLIKNGYDVVCAYDGQSAMLLFEQYHPALVILDLMLPGMSGEEVCRAIRLRSRTPVIMLSAKSAEESVVDGFGIGADDYVIKPFSPRQLMARVEAVLRRANIEAPLTSQLVFNDGDLSIDGTRREVLKRGERIGLTATEFNLLYTMAKYPQKIFTREELITSAISDGYEGFDRTIDTHIKNIRQKMENNPKEPAYIKTVHGVGYRFGGV